MESKVLLVVDLVEKVRLLLSYYYLTLSELNGY
jgi:hypothetical protein